MIYLKTGIGIELRGEDMLISSFQSQFTGGAFTHFTCIGDYRHRDKEELRQEILHFLKSNGLGKENIVLGISRRDIILRHLDFPYEVSDNLSQVVRYQVQSYEPTDEDRFYYDYVPLDGDNGKKKISVLLVMVRKTLLEEHLAFLQELGIRPSIVSCSFAGLSNIFLHDRKDVKDKTFLLADFTPSSLELLVMHQGAFRYSREVPKEEGQSWRDVILREVEEAASKMRFGPEDALEKLILAGDFSESVREEISSVIPDCELLKDSIRFGVPVENMPHLQKAATSIGLAFTGMVRRPPMRINLLPAELRIRQKRWAYVPTILLGLAILALLLSLGFHRMAQNRMLIRKLDREIETLKAPVARAQSFQNQVKELEEKIKSIEDLFGQRDMNLEILRELTTILPDDTYLRSYNYRDGNIQMSGLSNSSSDLIPKLENSPLLSNVSIRGSIYKDARTDKEQFTFEAELEK
jgi:Tfp pilus assembly protein PilN